MRYLAGVTSLAYDREKCSGCGRCTEVCPHGVFAMREKRAAVVDRDRCMECGACAKNCDFGAITVTAGVGCASAIIRSMIVGGEPTCGCGDGTAASSGGCC
ncbi:MAG: mercury methylation ferredoxin HgcB [Nitrospiraceae bacterium]|nr:mercury methylation ferredoxin HgcB [Nitrospiraceae bacterium]